MRLRGESLQRRGRAALLVLVAITACQPLTSAVTGTPFTAHAPPVAASPGAAPPVPVTPSALKGVTVGAWYPWFGVEASLFESLVADFNKENEWGIVVKPTSQNNYTELYTNVRAALPGDDRPQLVVALPEHALGWDAAGYVVDLTDYIHDPVYGFTADDITDFPPVFWSQDEAGGRRPGIPAEKGMQLVLYESAWARDLGFPAAPGTADEFRLQACRAHQAMSGDQDGTNDREGGWLVNTNPVTFLSWMLAFDGGVAEGNGYHFLTPKNLAALTFVKQLYDDGCSWMAAPNDDAATAFAGRRALFASAGIESLPDFTRAMAANSNGDTWTVLGFPGPGTTALVTYGSSYVVLRSSAEQQLASWLFVRWLLSPENQKRWVEVTGLLPLRTSTIGLLADYSRSHPQWSAAIDLLPRAKTQPELASWRQVAVMVGDGFDAMFRSNTPAGRVAEILAIMENTASDLSK
jgi:ABC-type glycerol-3-phosphate transport system substrate-binding protein